MMPRIQNPLSIDNRLGRLRQQATVMDISSVKQSVYRNLKTQKKKEEAADLFTSTKKQKDKFYLEKYFNSFLQLLEESCNNWFTLMTNALNNNSTNALKRQIKRNRDVDRTNFCAFNNMSTVTCDSEINFVTDGNHAISFTGLLRQKALSAFLTHDSSKQLSSDNHTNTIPTTMFYGELYELIFQIKVMEILQQKIVKLFTLMLLISSVIRPTLAQARHFECSLEQRDGQDFCIFKNVRLERNEVGVTFGFPGTTAPSNVAFEQCSMANLPNSFWDTFAGNLQILVAESCGLRSITATNKMEVLRAGNNSIKALTVPQNCNLNELDLSRNKLNNGQGIAKCNKLKILNLNDNEDFASNGVLDLAMFKPHTDLEQLYLSSVGVLYLENSKNIGLPLLHIIDLSRNRIIPADLSLDIFVPFTGLETLKLNNNAMGRLDYRQLRDIKALKAVYLNGNSFKCNYLVDMLAILHELNIETPTDRFGSCQPNDRELDGMCCLPSGPPTTTTSTTTTTTTTTERPTLAPEHTPTPEIRIDTTTPTTPDGGSNTLLIIGSIIGAIIALAVAGGAFVFCRKRQHQEVSQDDREMHKL